MIFQSKEDILPVRRHPGREVLFFQAGKVNSSGREFYLPGQGGRSRREAENPVEGGADRFCGGLAEEGIQVVTHSRQAYDLLRERIRKAISRHTEVTLTILPIP